MVHAQCSRPARHPQGFPIATLDRCRPAARLPRHDWHDIEIVGICACCGSAPSRSSAPDIATLRTLYRRRPTRFAHQRWAIKQWGLREFDPAIAQRLKEHLHSRTNATLSRGRLEQAAREWLYRAYVTIPRRRAITVLVRGVVQSVALQDHRDLRRYMTEWTVQGFIKE